MTVNPASDVSAEKTTEPTAQPQKISARPCLRLGKNDVLLRQGLNKAITHHGIVKEAWLIKKYLVVGLRAAGFIEAEALVENN